MPTTTLNEMKILLYMSQFRNRRDYLVRGNGTGVSCFVGYRRTEG
jgi:hypothetical protein